MSYNKKENKSDSSMEKKPTRIDLMGDDAMKNGYLISHNIQVH